VGGRRGVKGGGCERGEVTVIAAERCNPPTAPVRSRLWVSYPWKATNMEKVCSKKKASDISPASTNVKLPTQQYNPG
jgi:hypothetical protein